MGGVDVLWGRRRQRLNVLLLLVLILVLVLLLSNIPAVRPILILFCDCLHGKGTAMHWSRAMRCWPQTGRSIAVKKE